jgi:transmembrane protein
MSQTTPAPIRALLGFPGIDIILRVALAAPFLQSALAKSVDLPAAMAEMAHFGLPAATAIAVIATQAIGVALLLSRRFCWLGAGMLSVFTVLATLLAHSFWQFDGVERAHQTAIFFEHVALIGGLAIAAVLVDRKDSR